MTALFSTEVRRLLARRLVRVMAIVAALVVIIGGVVVFIQSDDKVSSRTTSTSRAIPYEAYESGETCFQDEDGSTRCEVIVEPGAGNFEEDKRFHYTDLWKKNDGGDPGGILSGFTIWILLLGVVMGASAIGAEWKAGTITTLLTWEPRRTRVLVAKVLAAAAVAAGFSLLVYLLVFAAYAPAALLQGTTEGVNGEWLRGAVGLTIRSALMTSVVSTLGFAISSLGRNTSAGVTVTFAYFTIGENLLRFQWPGWQPWLLGENIFTVLLGQSPYDLENANSPIGAGIIVACYVTVFLFAAIAVFRTRDVT